MSHKYVSRVIPQKNCRSRTMRPIPLGIVILAKIGSYSGRNSTDESRQLKPGSRFYEIRSGLFVEVAELRRVGRSKAHRWWQQWRPHSKVAGSVIPLDTRRVSRIRKGTGSTHRSFSPVRTCGWALFELGSDAPITLSWSRRATLWPVAETCLLVALPFVIVEAAQQCSACTTCSEEYV